MKVYPPGTHKSTRVEPEQVNGSTRQRVGSSPVAPFLSSVDYSRVIDLALYFALCCRTTRQGSDWLGGAIRHVTRSECKLVEESLRG